MDLDHYSPVFTSGREETRAAPQLSQDAPNRNCQVDLPIGQQQTKYAADGTLINTTDVDLNDDHAAEGLHTTCLPEHVPLVNLSESHHPAPPTIHVDSELSQSKHRTVEHQETVRNYHCLGLLVCLCCCFAVGICAMWKANQAEDLTGQGKIREARAAAKQSMLYSIVGVVAGLLLWSGIVGFVVVLYFDNKDHMR